MTSLFQKLKLRPGDCIQVLNHSEDFEAVAGNLPHGITYTADSGKATKFFWFVTSRAQLEKGYPGIRAKLRPGCLLWVLYPKKRSGVQTDLSRDAGWEAVMGDAGIQWLSLISFDETWSAFAIRLMDATARRAAAKPAEDYSAWYDAKLKKVKIPADLKAGLKAGKGLLTFFESLSFTQRKEAVLSVVSAKRAETRSARIMKLCAEWQKKMKTS